MDVCIDYPIYGVRQGNTYDKTEISRSIHKKSLVSSDQALLYTKRNIDITVLTVFLLSPVAIHLRILKLPEDRRYLFRARLQPPQ